MDNDSLSPEIIAALLSHLAEHPTTSLERWMAYREICLTTGRSVFWLMRPRQEDQPITSITLVDGQRLQAENRALLMKQVLAMKPDQKDILAFVDGGATPAPAPSPPPG